MIYDTLFALDGNLEVKPQMVDKWTTSDDKLTWTFTLRDGLEFHDGTPVTAEDVVPSLKRWAVRDPLGQLLWTKVAEVKAVDPKTFQIQLKAPTGIMLQALGKPSGTAFIMPKKVAETDPVQADRGLHRLRPVHLREERMEARRQDGLRQEPQVQAARRAALGPGRRQDRQGRSRRMGGDPRPADGDQRPAQGRDRHDRDAAARPASRSWRPTRTSSWSTSTSGATSTSSASTSSSSRSTIPRSARRCSTPSTRRTFSTA